MKKMFCAALCVAGLVALAGCSSGEKSGGSEAEKQAPDVFKVNFDTSRGTIVVEAHRDWAPHGADHLYYLVKQGYYDGNKFFRVVRNFCAQFGMNGDPKKTAMWGNTQIPDDVPLHDNTLGTLTFAATGQPNSRTTQLFFNLNNNTQSLNPQGFAPLGVVISGLDVMESLYGGYGDAPPNGTGPDQNQIRAEGNAYLDAKFPHLDYINKATIQ